MTSTSGRAQNLKKKCELCFGRFRCIYIIFAEFNYWNVVLHTFRLWNRPNTMNEILSSWLPPVDVFQQHMFLCVRNTYDFDKKVDYTKNIQPSVALIICNYGTWIFYFFFQQPYHAFDIKITSIIFVEKILHILNNKGG